MPTKTPREIELEEKIYELSRLIETSAEWWHTFNHDVYLPALKTLLEEARQETKEKIKKYIDDNRVVLNSNDIFSVRCEKEATNSTLDDLEYFIKSL